MFEAMFLVPKQDNDGQAFDVAHDSALEVEALKLFGGFTWRGEAVGGWKDDAGRVYHDASRTFIVVTASIVDGAKLGQLAAFLKAHYRQEAVYLTYLGQAEIL